ncbi:DUF3795 domain-containing protein, partial [uncultured Anaerotruncus sp.]|uniref:DUF3795 domain-containing protein n=1 Tax=uncultured Anaerotruncus sp. TaxID=905011 RepID=UPI0035A5EFC4
SRPTKRLCRFGHGAGGRYHTREAETMIESRCGLLCGECSYREPMGCKGCAVIEKPFWGDACPVKSCCEAKGLEHCGACGEFPCALLTGFAYDPDQGDDGKRIEQCRLWRGAEKEAL